MAISDNTVSAMVNGMLYQEREFSIPGTNIDPNELMLRVFSVCPKLQFIHKHLTLKYNESKGWIFTYRTDYRAVLEYEAPCKGFNLNDVLEDNGSFEIMQYLKSYKKNFHRYPMYIPIVSSDTKRILNALDINVVHQEFLGIENLLRQGVENSYLTIFFEYKYDPEQIYNMELAAEKEAEKLVIYLYGDGKIPPFLKIFLAFSYIQQTAKYDSVYIEAQKRGVKGMDIAPELPFSILGSMSKKAVSKGISEAFKLIMDKSGIECILVPGKVNITNSEDAYYWNLVKINGVWYHIDATWFIDKDGINVARFMCNDHIFLKEHEWYQGTPNAKGTTYNYDNIEEHIDENYDKYIDAGVPEKHLRPAEVFA